ncbi:MFS transporter [Massilia solisilvae]|uniref:MFS transporter n=1 Tax=Massilia solisilvae TaxID=1811225 RepID=A0ABT2BM89_9BURK|nr:MFS transporter [Massilia solisilvae]MCS0609511.1 MFS transporter [Massilia solisilvae]
MSGTSTAHARATVGILAVTQITSWGALYYAFAVVAPRIQAELGMGPELVFGAFSWSLLVSGLAATPVGVLLDRFGGRYVMAAGSLLSALGLAWLGSASGVVSYYGAWSLIGLAMALTLYEAAFATINRELASGARRAISTLTLFGGLASTLFWPLTSWLDARLGWRATFLWYAGAQALVCFPLHLLLGRGGVSSRAARTASAKGHTLAQAVRQPVFWMLAFAFSANTFVFSAMAAHLIPLLRQLGVAAGTAVLLAAMIGPMQVAGRLCEMAFACRVTPQGVGKLTFATLPAALLILYLGGAQASAAAAFCILYGLSNGILTIVRGTLPQALFGSEHYGAIAGAMAAPSLLSKAAGPLLAAMFLHASGTPSGLVLVMLAVSVISFAFYLAAVRVARGRSSASLAMPVD